MAVEILKSKGIYRKAFKWIVENSTSNNLPYHNMNHLMSVFSSCYDACNFYHIVDMNGEAGEIELSLAALFHDVNHSGGKLSDDKNIEIAIDSFSNFTDSLDDDMKHTFNKDNVIETIKATQYPYEVTDIKELTLYQRILRDADLISAFDGDWIQSVVFGLREEMGVTTLEERIQQQVGFILNLKPCTDWGTTKLEKTKGRTLNELANILSIMQDKEYKTTTSPDDETITIHNDNMKSEEEV